MQSVPITTKVVSSYPVHGLVYSIQQYVIKFVSILATGGFLQVLGEVNSSLFLFSCISNMRNKGCVRLSVNHIGGVMINLLVSIAVDRGFESRSSQTKDCKIVLCCFSAKHVAFRRKSKYWLARNQDNVSE